MYSPPRSPNPWRIIGIIALILFILLLIAAIIGYIYGVTHIQIHDFGTIHIYPEGSSALCTPIWCNTPGILRRIRAVLCAQM